MKKSGFKMKNPSVAKLAKSAGDNRKSPMPFGVFGTGLGTLFRGNAKAGAEASNKKSKSKSDPYAEAKKRDPKLDSYIKERNKHKKGTPEYNAQQNKINKAYGKGPTNRSTTPGPKPTKATVNNTQGVLKDDKGNFADNKGITDVKKTTTTPKPKRKSRRPKFGTGVQTLREKNKRKFGKRTYNPSLNRFE